MRFVSSRGESAAVSLTDALFANLAPDGGLWCPERLEPLPASFFDRLNGMPPADVIRAVGLHLFDDAIPREDVEALVASSLDFPIPLVEIGDGVWALELFHGPTLAFKDVGARFMARLMRHAVEQTAEAGAAEGEPGGARRVASSPRPDGDTFVLVATSGDTGSAVARAFLDVPGFHVVVLFPEGRISEPQRKLMTTLGGNVTCLAVAGSFDDCQRLVKEAFADPELRGRVRLASANSINVGRLLPQVLYYFLAVAQLPPGLPKPIVATPSGNFGNLTAGLYAKRLGLPVERFVAATNINDVIPEYLETGVFRPRASWQTLSNAMDVGNPSNFERIRALYDGDLDALRRDLAGARFTDDEVVAAIAEVHAEHGYLLDPHSAVGWLAIQSLRSDYPLNPGVVLATAHPAKFPLAVEAAIGAEIDPPAALREPMSRPESSVPIAAEYAALRRFLVER
jgi:threonine synthase